MHALPSFSASSPQQSLAFLPKHVVDVRQVEVQRAWRLTPKTIEEVRFRIQRKLPELFQDDVYALGADAGPRVEASEWEGGREGGREWIDLRPEGMKKRQSSQKIPGLDRADL